MAVVPLTVYSFTHPYDCLLPARDNFTAVEERVTIHAMMKTGRPALLFYLIALPVLLLTRKYCPSGPCTPNLDLFSLLGILIAAVLLCLRYMGKAINRQDRSYLVPAALHAVAAVILMLFFCG